VNLTEVLQYLSDRSVRPLRRDCDRLILHGPLLTLDDPAFGAVVRQHKSLLLAHLEAQAIAPDGNPAWRTADVGGQSIRYRVRWNGCQLCPPDGYLAFDTETTAEDDLLRVIPTLALASVSDGASGHTLIHPDELDRFILAHRQLRWICHNAAFDFWVVAQHLQKQGTGEALAAWWEIADGRLHDSMLLDSLVGLAIDDSYPRPRDLGIVAAEYGGLKIDKQDPYRLRYGEIINVDWNTVDPGFFDYVIKDAIVTHAIHAVLRRKATELIKRYERDIVPGAVEQFGLLTETLQVRKAIALAQITRNGMRLDRDWVQREEQAMRAHLDAAEARLAELCPNLYQCNRDGSPKRTNSGARSRSNTVLISQLQTVKAQLETEGIRVWSPPSKTRPLSTRAEYWEEHREHNDFLDAWLTASEAAKLFQFFQHLHAEEAHPRYATMVRSGRTSAADPNIQQMPRKGPFRGAFVASPGTLLVATDYRFIELVTFAVTAQQRVGYSQLGDVIRQGVDPHAHTAALLLGVPPAEFLRWGQDPEKAPDFKEARQRAKPVNFGVPAGLSAGALKPYAKNNYGVGMTKEEAEALRQQLIDGYSELKTWLSDDAIATLACTLDVPLPELTAAFASRAIWWTPSLTAIQRVLAGKPKKDGEPYKERYVNAIWGDLARWNRRPEFSQFLQAREPSAQLARRICQAGVATTTGRIRGSVKFTQAKNSPFQGLAADGAALALFALIRAGIRVVAFVHDEIIAEVTAENGSVAQADVKQIEHIMVREMARVCGDIVPSVKSAVMERWAKGSGMCLRGDRYYPDSTGDTLPSEDAADVLVVIRNGNGAPITPPSPPSEDVASVPIVISNGEETPATPDKIKPPRRQTVSGPCVAQQPIAPPVKKFGGKANRRSFLARWILSYAREHRVYIEPFLGGGSVLLAKVPSPVEIINDLNSDLSNLWNVLKSDELFPEFLVRVRSTPFGIESWKHARDQLAGRPESRLDRAKAYFVCSRLSRGGQGESFMTHSTRTRRGMPENESAWLSAIENLPDVHERLRGVTLLQPTPAIDVIRQYDEADALIYCDPPYVADSRSGIGQYGDHEMSDEEHRQLLEVLRQCQGHVLLSGYSSKLYDEALHDWACFELVMPADSAGGKAKGRRIERLWSNRR
jgi:DNA adenine methylase